MAADSHWPIVLIEGVLVLGGALAFGWWQLRSVRRDQELAAARRKAEQEAAARSATPEARESSPPGTSPTPPPTPPG